MNASRYLPHFLFSVQRNSSSTSNMVNQASEPPTRTGDSNVVSQVLVPVLCEQLGSTQLALVETRAENASLREEMAAKDAANASFMVFCNAQFASQEAINAQQEAINAQQEAKFAQQEAINAKNEARFAKIEAYIGTEKIRNEEALARKDARIADLVAQVQLLTAQQAENSD